MPYKEQRQKSKSIGSAIHVSKSSGQLIVKASDEVSIGDFVYDSKHRRVGVVFDFFGPVGAPYIAVKPHCDPSRVLGFELFVEPRVYHGKKH